MPKKVFDKLISDLMSDIRLRYPLGSRYRSIRNIVAEFNVSLQTAHRAVKKLSADGIVKTAGKSGIFVESHTFKVNPTGQKILVCSGNPDPRFNEAFLTGIKEVTEKHLIKVAMTVNKFSNVESLEFGNHLLSLYKSSSASAIIAIYFRKAELAFYHLISNGIDIISDISLENLPILPSVQTDNAKHTRLAAQIFRDHGKTNILVTGFWDRDNVRYNSFCKAMKKYSPDCKIQYLNLGESNSQAHLFLFFKKFNKSKGVFSLDYSANYVVAPCFITNNIKVENNFLVYDCEDESFIYNGLQPISKVAPSFRDLGRNLARKLIFKMENGFWGKPLRERI